MQNHKLADTFAIIANDPQSFYTGQLAKHIEQEIKSAGIKLTV